MIDKRFYKYFLAIAIFSVHLRVTAQTQPDTPAKTSSTNFEGLSSSWANAVRTHSLESATKINAIEFSPDGQLLATVGGGKITIWNIKKGEKTILPGHYSTETGMEIAPTAIAFSPDGRFLATSTGSQGVFSPDSSILVRDITTGETVLNISDAEGYWQVLFDLSGEVIYSAGNSGVTAWSFPDGDKLFSLDTQHPVEAIALSPDGRVMATVDANLASAKPRSPNQIQLWQLNEQQPTLLNTLDGHVNEIAKLEFTADGKRLISSSYDGKIKVWDWQQGAIDSRTNFYSDNGVFSLGVDSRLIAGNFYSSTITDLNTGLPLRNTIATSDNKKTNIAFSPTQRLIALVETSDSNTSSINLWLADGFPAEKSSNPKTNYRPISIAEYWSDKPALKDTSAIGKDPLEIALSALGLTEIAESEQEVELNYPSDNLATVTITQTNLADDSVAGIRHLVHFAPYADDDGEKWQVVWAGQQFKCQPGRGDRDWSPNLCQ